jgi:hypothetical protein
MYRSIDRSGLVFQPGVPAPVEEDTWDDSAIMKVSRTAVQM